MTFILGTVQLGLNYGIKNESGQPTAEQAMGILARAKSLGIKYLDTSDLYGSSSDVIREFGADQFKILTKFSLESQSFASALEASLKRLQAEKLYSYSFHRFNDFEQFENWDEVEDAKENGEIQFLGVSVYTNEQLEAAIDNEHIDIIQSPFNLLDGFHRRGDLFERAHEEEKEIHVRSVYLQGLLLMDPNQLKGKLASLSPAITELKEIAKSAGKSMEELCFGYANSFDSIDAVVVGVENQKQLEQSFALSKSAKLDSGLISEIESVLVQDEALLNPSNWNPK